MSAIRGTVVGVSTSPTHDFSKVPQACVRLIAGFGIEGDAHAGVSVKHRSAAEKTPGAPNLRQVHIINAELFAVLAERGYAIAPGELGENITVEGFTLIDLPRDTILEIGPEAAVRVTGLRNPCHLIEAFRPGLVRELLGKAADGRLIRKAGIMSVVERSGVVTPGDMVVARLPPEPHQVLDRV
jgi:MOSC domain-containing protein YiiM